MAADNDFHEKADQPMWASLVLQWGPELQVAPHHMLHEQEHARGAVWQQSGVPVIRVFDMREVVKACSCCLKGWFCPSRIRVVFSSQVQQYGRFVLHRNGMDTHSNLYAQCVKSAFQLPQ